MNGLKISTYFHIRDLFIRGGYLVIPERMEFWQGQTNRMHDRIQFRKRRLDDRVDGVVLHAGENGWVFERLAP